MKTVKIIFFVCIAGFVLAAVFSTNIKPDAVSVIDNRNLVKWKGDIDPYFRDRIGFRDKMINWYTVYNDRVFNEMVHPVYEYGRNGYVFLKFQQENYDKEFIDLFCRYIRLAQDYCTQRSVVFLYVYNPSKISVYDQYLPRGYQYKNDCYALMRENLSYYGVHYVDNLSYLKEISKSLGVFNRKYDAGHWNDWGAFYATNHMLEEIAKDYPEVRQYELDDFEIDTVVAKSLPVSVFIVNEKVPDMKLCNNDFTYVGDRYRGIYLHPKHQAFGAWQTENKQRPDVMFFHGSYYNSRIKFYQDRFHKVVGIHNYENFLNFDYYFNLVKPDYVILETAEYTLNDKFFDKQVLKTKVLNPPYDSVAQDLHEKLVAADLKDYEEEDQGKLIKISFSVPENMTFGYLFVGKTEYDLQLNGKTAKVTLLKTEYDKDSVSVALFAAR
ncbi:MAG: hypothetical protein J1F29_01265 [Lentimicrobiaceae bacterium]|nr:hypothetical protein [Lentimicrobiaceae bacterium]